MRYPKIEEAITFWWGPRCKDFEPDCEVCQAWKEYDEARGKSSRPVVEWTGNFKRV